VGCSWQGNLTKRDGKLVTCGHKHLSHETAKKCLRRMRRSRPGNCQNYITQKVIWRKA